MKLRLTPEATADIDSAHDWYLAANPAAASRFIDAVDNALAAIVRIPQAYPRIHGEMRRAVIHHFPYVMFYVDEHDEIVVYACCHGARNPDAWKRRLNS